MQWQSFIPFVCLVFIWGVGYWMGRADRKAKSTQGVLIKEVPTPAVLNPDMKHTCGDSGCDGRADPRCSAGNCARHCAFWCGGSCRVAWLNSERAGDWARAVMQKARTP